MTVTYGSRWRRDCVRQRALGQFNVVLSITSVIGVLMAILTLNPYLTLTLTLTLALTLPLTLTITMTLTLTLTDPDPTPDPNPDPDPTPDPCLRPTVTSARAVRGGSHHLHQVRQEEHRRGAAAAPRVRCGGARGYHQRPRKVSRITTFPIFPPLS